MSNGTHPKSSSRAGRAGVRFGRATSAVLYAIAWAATLTILVWVGVEVLGYPEPPTVSAEDKTAAAGMALRLSRGSQHVLIVRGQPYALGFHNARLFADLMWKQEQTLFNSLFYFAKNPTLAMVIRHMSLGYLVGFDEYLSLPERQEILGLAEGTPDPFPDLGPRYARIAAYHALHELSQRFAFDNPLTAACSLMAVGGNSGQDGHALLARNFDFEGGEVFDRDKVVLAVKPTTGFGFVSIVWGGMAGVVTGINERGLAIVINAGASADFRRVGTPTTLLVRRSLEQASTVDEAVAVLTSSPSFVTDILGITDAAGNAAVLELTPSRHAVRRAAGHGAWGTDILVASNQLESAELADDPVNLQRQTQTTTRPRRSRLGRIAEDFRTRGTPVSVSDLLEVMRDRRGAEGGALPLGHRHALDAMIATHSVIMDSTAGRVWVSEGPHTLGPYFGYDVAKLVNATNEVEAREAMLPELPADPLLSRYPLVELTRAAWRTAQSAIDAGDVEAAEQALSTVQRGPLAQHPTTFTLSGRAALLRRDLEAAQVAFAAALAAPPEYPADAAWLEEQLGQLRDRSASAKAATH